jgi:ABC-2 type transport system permease protein
VNLNYHPASGKMSDSTDIQPNNSTKSKVKFQGLVSFLSKTLVLSVVAIASYFYFFKVDLTEDKRYTLSDETIELLQSMDDVAEFKIYLEGETLPVGFVKLRNAINETLDEFSEHANGNIEFEFIDIKDISTEKKQEREIIRLSRLGIPYLPNEQKKTPGNEDGSYVIPGAEVFYNGRSGGVNLLVTSKSSYEQNFNESIESLEYQLSNAIRKLQRERPKNIGFLQLHGESGQYELEDFAKSLSEYYNIGPIFLQNEKGLYDLNSLNLIDILVIAGPKSQFNELELVIIDQFVMKGGKLLCILDGIYAELDSLRTTRQFFPAMPYNSGLEKLLYKYGVRVNNDLVEDQQCTRIPIQSGPEGSKPQLSSWVYFPLIFSENTHIINKNLDPVKMEFASTLDSITTPGITHTALLNTSGLNRYVKTPTSIGLEDAFSGASEKKLHDGKKCVAFLTEGKYTSYYKNRILPKEFSSHKKFLDESPVNKMIIISSGSFANSFVLSDNKTLPLGADRYSSAFYDNKKFLLNVINYLSDDKALITIRSKKIEMRLLDKKKVKTYKSTIKWLNLLVPPGIILLISLLFFFIRKGRYS